MRELRTCDFCDADAVGAFAVVPPELEPSEDEQRRVVLCDDCKVQLKELLEPLLARAGLNVDAQTDDSGTDGETQGRPTAQSATGMAQTDESDTSDVSNATEPTAEADETDAAEGEDAARSTDAATPTESATTEFTGVESSDAKWNDTESSGESAEPTSRTGRSQSVNSAHDGTKADAEPATSAAESKSVADGSGAGAGYEGGITFERTGPVERDESGEPKSEPPKGYRKVVRLLQNREFPMPRSDVQELAASAYDLEPYQVSAVIDHAIEEGEFVEKRGDLQRPDDS